MLKKTAAILISTMALLDATAMKMETSSFAADRLAFRHANPSSPAHALWSASYDGNFVKKSEMAEKITKGTVDRILKSIEGNYVLYVGFSQLSMGSGYTDGAEGENINSESNPYTIFLTLNETNVHFKEKYYDSAGLLEHVGAEKKVTYNHIYADFRALDEYLPDWMLKTPIFATIFFGTGTSQYCNTVGAFKHFFGMLKPEGSIVFPIGHECSFYNYKQKYEFLEKGLSFVSSIICYTPCHYPDEIAEIIGESGEVSVACIRAEEKKEGEIKQDTNREAFWRKYCAERKIGFKHC